MVKRSKKVPIPTVDQRKIDNPNTLAVQMIKNPFKYKDKPSKKVVPTFAQKTPMSSSAREIQNALDAQKRKVTKETIKANIESLVERIRSAKYIDDISMTDLARLQALDSPRLTRRLLGKKPSRNK